MNGWRRFWIAGGFVAAVLLTLLSILPAGVHWGPDAANRAIQTENIRNTGRLPIAWPGAVIDPDLRFAPRGGHHFQQFGDGLFSFYAPWFSALNDLLGVRPSSRAALLLPICSTLLLLPVTGALFLSLNSDSRKLWLVPLLVVFATPILFYSLVYWEHTLAVLAGTAALLMQLDTARIRTLIAAGVFFGLAAVLREETYLYFAAVVVSSIVTKQLRRPQLLALVAGFLTIAAPFAVANQFLFGHPLGVHASTYAAMSRQSDAFMRVAHNLFVFLFEASESWRVSLLHAVPIVMLLATSFLRASDGVTRLRVAMMLLLAGGTAAAGAALASSSAPYEMTLYAQGLFSTVPLCVLALMEWREGDRRERFLVLAFVTGALGCILLLNQEDVGIIWGPRHFLWTVPIVVSLSITSFARMRERLQGGWRALLAAAFVLVVASSAAIQFHGVTLLQRKLSFSQATLQAIDESNPQAVVTDVFWVPEDLAALYFRIPIFEVRGDRELAALMSLLDRQQVRSVVFVAARRHRRVSQAAFRQLTRRVTERVRINGGEPLLDVMLLKIEPALP